MADIKIIKFKVRRGLNSQRKRIILEQGELGYTSDTKRLFVGDGYLSGGVVAGNIAHTPLTINNSRINISDVIVGDIVNENGYLYQLVYSDFTKLSNWSFIGTNVDNQTVAYDSSRRLSLNSNSVSAIHLSQNAAYNMGGLSTSSNGISANVDNITLTITNTNQLSVFKINETNIVSSALGYGLQGGNGVPISVNLNDVSTAVLTSIPNNSVGLSSINSTALGQGLQLSAGVVAADFRSVDTNVFYIDPTIGRLELNTVASGTTAKLANITFNDYGQILSIASSITQVLSSNHDDSPSSLFNGSLNQQFKTNQTIISAISTNATNDIKAVSLSSAGFMVLDTALGNIAIPVFKY